MMNREPDIAVWETNVGQVGADRTDPDRLRVTFQGKRYAVNTAQELAEALADAIDWLNGDDVVDAQILPDNMTAAEWAEFKAWRDQKHERTRSEAREPGDRCTARALAGLNRLDCDRSLPTGADPVSWRATHRHHAMIGTHEWVWNSDGTPHQIVTL